MRCVGLQQLGCWMLHLLDVIDAMTSKEAVTDFCPEAVEAILSAFNDRVLQAIHEEEGSITSSFATTSGKPLSRPWRIQTLHGVK